MIFSKEVAVQQVANLLHRYNGLYVNSMSEEKISLMGSITVNMSSLGFTLYKTYRVEIIIPLDSDELPYVLDVGNQIDGSYPHRYVEGKLCLETDTNIRIRFIDGFSLETWMSEYVETYFFSYEFYQRYGEFPFGERGHGWDGIIQTYSDFFNEADGAKTIKIMASISNGKYRGHALCPCGSGQKLRSCHGPYIMKFYMDNRLKSIVRKDFFLLQEAVQKYNEQQHNTRAAKR